MAGTIVVGVDDRPESRDAASLARLLAQGMNARVVIAAAMPYGPHPIGEEGYLHLLDEDGERRAAAVGPLLEGLEVETRIFGGTGALGSGGPARALHDVAEAERADAVVIGSTHRGMLGRILPGSIGERLLTAAPCAVAVAPRGFADRDRIDLTRIAVGYDGLPESREALRVAGELALACGAELELLTVVEAPGVMAEWPEFHEMMESGFRDRLERGHASISGDLPSTARLLEGFDPEGLVSDAAAALVRATEDADLLVIGSRGYGPVRRVLLGGVSAPVMRAAHCPVLVVPRAAAAASDAHGRDRRDDSVVATENAGARTPDDRGPR